VYGGSTSVGFYAIQLAKLLGYKVATACSPRNFDVVKSYGADAAFDYKDADACVKSIREVSGGGVDVAMDCVSEGESQIISMKSFNDKPGHQLNIILIPDPAAAAIRPDIPIAPTLLYTVWGEVSTIQVARVARVGCTTRTTRTIAPETKYGSDTQAFNFGPREGPEIPLPALPDQRAWFAELVAKTPEFIEVLGIRPAPYIIRGGLEDIPAGFADMQAGKVSAQRLVYKI
jgi:hypothetical protein